MLLVASWLIVGGQVEGKVDVGCQVASFVGGAHGSCVKTDIMMCWPGAGGTSTSRSLPAGTS